MATNLKQALEFIAPANNNIEPPMPLRRAVRGADPYPIEALGVIIGAAAAAAAKHVQAPLELCAQSSLANAALAVQGHINVVRPWTDRAEPVSLFLLSVAGTGDRKTTADNLLGGEVISDFESEREADNYHARLAYENAKEGYDAARATAKAKAVKDSIGPDAIAKALRDVGEPPSPPLSATMTFSDPTVEGLHRHYSSGQPSAAVFSSEGGSFVGGVGMTPENALKTAAQLSELWDGSAIKRLRAGDGATVLRHRRLCFHLMIQPLAASAWLSNPTLRDQGLFSRLLIASPVSLAGTRMARIADPANMPAIHAFRRQLASLLRQPLPINPDRPGELQPRAINMTAEAQQLIYGFTNTIEEQIGQNGKLLPVIGLANKIGDHAVRIAAVLGAFENPHVAAIDRDLMARGVKLAQWYLDEALRLAEAGSASPDLMNAEKVLDWAKDHGGVFSLPCVYQNGPYAVRDKKSAASAIAILKEHHCLDQLADPQVIDGRRRRECFKLRSA
jgi:hypothetical protein